MQTFHVVKKLPYRAEELYAIVAEVEKYQEFVPACKRSTVKNRQEDASGTLSFEATLEICYPKLQIVESFVSNVVCDTAHLTVTSTGARGPLSHLKSQWAFKKTPSMTHVSLTVTYEVRPFALRFLVALSADYMTKKMVSAFEERARSLLIPVSAS